MQFQLPFLYILKRPGGTVNLLLIVVCQFIPIIGPIVLYGYRAEVAVALDNDPDMQRHPKFNFDRFGHYLKRGILPFLVSFLLELLNIPIVFGIVIVTFLINPPGQNNAPAVEFVILFCVEMTAVVALQMLDFPMAFYTEISGRFDLGGAFRFAMQFWKLVGWVPLATGFVFVFLAALVLLAGLLCCFVGIYPAIAINQMAAQHLMCQLYRLYLYRGGEPIPVYKPSRDRNDEYVEETDDEYEEEHRERDW
jgi:hypothetical protein